MAKMTGFYQNTERTVTGFRSLDLAFPQYSKDGKPKLGYPNLHTLVYGKKGEGKSLFCIEIGGIIAQAQGKNIAYLPNEGFDPEWYDKLLDSVGFDGEFKVELGEETDEKNIDNMLEDLSKEKFAIGILDTIAGLQSTNELSAESVVENQMGRRAQLTAKLYRHLNHQNLWRETQFTFFGITHELKPFELYSESTKPGGDTKGYLSRIWIQISREKWDKESKLVLEDGSFLMRGTVQQFNYGKKGKKFFVFVLSDFGFHQGMTAVYDCLEYGIAKRKTGYIVLSDTVKYRFDELLGYAHAGEDAVFQPFMDALQDVYGVVQKVEEE